jgi:autotransporter-associated beta strand protein
MAYGATALPNFTSTVTGLVNGDQANVVISTTATPYNLSAGSASNVGSYTITAASVSNPNYYPVSTNGTLTVTPINLTIQASTQGGPGAPILYGTPTVLKQTSSQNPLDNALTATGLTNGDYVSGATISFNGAATVSGTTAAGTYTGGLQVANATGSGLANYNITYTSGNLIIGKALLTVTAANDAKLQGQADGTNFNGVIFSGFKNGENVSTVNMSGLSITRTNATINAVGTYSGVLQVGGIDASNYSITFAPGNYTIVGPGQLLVKVAPVFTEYGTAPVYSSPTAAYIPLSVSNPTATSAVSLNAIMSGTNAVTVSDGAVSMNVNLSVANPVNSSSGNLIVGAYGLNSTSQNVTASGFTNRFTAMVTVGGITVTPKVLSFSDFGVSGVSKVYDGSTSMNSISFAPATPVFISQDMVNPVANGTFTDRHVGINKSYTVGVTFAGTDAGNYVMSGGAIYTADDTSAINHGPANGAITQLNSVTYTGATTGGAWSDPASWRATNGATSGAIPDRSNVANIVIPVGNTVVYDSQVLGPVTANLLNSGNVNFIAISTLPVSMNISGAGSITIGSGTVSLSGNNTYTGNAIISSGATLMATASNSVGAGNIQGLGGSFGTSPGVILSQLNASGTLRLISDITTTGNQAYGNLIVTQARTTLLSQNGNITFNGTVDGATVKTNTLLVQSPGTVTFSGSVGSILPINVLEVDAARTYIYADVLTADQQNYCGISGCYTALTAAQVTANYCVTNDCFSKNNNTSAYSLLAANTGGTGDFAKNSNIGQVFIGDNGQVGFLYNTYNSYATSAFGATAPLFQNNPVFARTLISRDPMVTFGSYISDASANATHTMQVAAIQVPGVTTAPTVQLNGSGNSSSTSALYSFNALTQSISAANALAGSIKNAANSTLEAFKSISLGSNSIGLNNVSLAAQNLNLVYPPNGLTTNASSNFKADTARINGRTTTTIGGRAITTYTPSAPATTPTSTSRNSFIMSSISQQTKLDRKYAVEASVDVGEIEMDDRPADKEKDEEDRKKKKGGKTT